MSKGHGWNEAIQEITKEWEPDYDGAKQALDMARSIMNDRFKGINEAEAIAYARGFAHGMAVSGRNGQDARITMEYERLKHPILDAGCSYMGHALIESVCLEEMGVKKS